MQIGVNSWEYGKKELIDNFLKMGCYKVAKEGDSLFIRILLNITC